MTRFFAFITSLITLFAALISFNANASNPYQLMEQVGDSTFSRITSEQSKIDADPNYLKQIVEEEVMPYIHYQYAGLKLLGPLLKQQDKQEVQQFLQAFRSYMVTSYAQVFAQYTNQQLKYAPQQTVAEGTRIVTVPVEIIEPGKPNIQIAFKWRSNKAGTEWQAFDIIAEGISMLSSKQSEWSGKIRSDGLAVVTDELNQLAAVQITKPQPK